MIQDHFSMKKFITLSILLSQLAVCQSVEEVGKKVLTTMEQMSKSWKKVKKQQDSRAQGEASINLAKLLTTYAEELKSYPIPDNATRIKIKASRAEKIEQISMEMGGTLVLLGANAPLMAAFSSELNKVKAEMDKSTATFNAYFEPDTVAAEPKKK